MNDIALLLNSIANILSPWAWPIILLVLGIIYKKSISSMLQQLASRVTKLGVSGADFGNIPPLQKDEDGTLKDKSTLDDALKNLPLINHYNELVFSELEKGAKASNLDIGDYAKAKVTELYIAWHYEKIYRAIYGSQIIALQMLNSHGLKSTKTEIKTIYDNAKSNAPSIYENISYENWLDFLVFQSLINMDGDNIEISMEGQGFLSYIAEQNYSFVRTL